jgi:imidazolonepropionase-like amidohydrolase
MIKDIDIFIRLTFLLGMAFLFCCQSKEDSGDGISELSGSKIEIRGVNEKELPSENNLKAIIGATLLDGTGAEPLSNAVVIIEGDRILSVGKKGAIEIPEGSVILDASGKFILPGFMDAHFHLDRSKKLPNIFLQNGITSLRDPGAWIEAYNGERQEGYDLPRLFLTGPHFDMYPPAYPNDAIIIRDEKEARMQVNKLADKGASAIKIYFRLSLGLIKAVCDEADKRGMVVTGHLETTTAMDAIHAGLDGIEHVTSVGTSLISDQEAENYRQAILLDNNARRSGRYEMWEALTVEGPKADSLIHLMVQKNTFLSATLAVYEVQDPHTDSIQFKGFQKMLTFIGKANKAGVSMVVGSHSVVPFAELGWAFHRELELLANCGLSNQEIIMAATLNNARFFQVEDRLGSIENGKQADLVVLGSNPLTDIRNMRKIEKVMLNGVWIK